MLFARCQVPVKPADRFTDNRGSVFGTFQPVPRIGEDDQFVVYALLPERFISPMAVFRRNKVVRASHDHQRGRVVFRYVDEGRVLSGFL